MVTSWPLLIYIPKNKIRYINFGYFRYMYLGAPIRLMYPNIIGYLDQSVVASEFLVCVWYNDYQHIFCGVFNCNVLLLQRDQKVQAIQFDQEDQVHLLHLWFQDCHTFHYSLEDHLHLLVHHFLEVQLHLDVQVQPNLDQRYPFHQPCLQKIYVKKYDYKIIKYLPCRPGRPSFPWEPLSPFLPWIPGYPNWPGVPLNPFSPDGPDGPGLPVFPLYKFY